MRHIRPILEEFLAMTNPYSTASGWASTLDAQQRAACQAIMLEHSPFPERQRVIGFPGWTVYMEPTVGRPYYLELRQRDPDPVTGGRLLRHWIITDERRPQEKRTASEDGPSPSWSLQHSTAADGGPTDAA